MSEIPLINARQSSTETRYNCAGVAGKCAAVKAIDGDVTTNSVTRSWHSNFGWWSAQLASRAIVKEVILTTGSWAFGEGYFNRLRVDTAENANGPWVPCKGEFKLGQPIVNHVVTCDQANIANFVRLAVTGALSLYLNEVKVKGEIVGKMCIKFSSKETQRAKGIILVSNIQTS